MKKIIALLLVLVMALGLFAGCAEEKVEDTGLTAAKDYLYAMYKEENGTKTTRDFTRVAVVRINGVSYNIDWSVKVTEGDEAVVSLEKNEAAKTVTVKISETVPKETKYNLIATLRNEAGDTQTVEFNHIVPKVPTAAEILDMAYALESGAVLEGTYKLTGVISKIDTAWSDDYKNITVTIICNDDAERPMMCYRLVSGETTDASKLAVGDTITVEGTIKNYSGTVEFDAKCVLLNVVPGEGGNEDEGNKEPVEAQLPTVTAPAADKAYKFGVIQLNVGKTIYITGEVDNRFLVTTDNKAESKDTYVEVVDGGVKIYFLEGDTKNYIELYNNEEAKAALKYGAEGTVFAIDEKTGAWAADLEGTMYYMGCYNEFETISPSKTSYISEENAGISQFPAGFFEVEGNDAPVIPDKGDEENKGDEGNTDAPNNGGNAPAGDPAADTELTIEQAIALGSSKEHNTYTEGKYYVTGVITEIYNTQYGNMKITDSKGNILTIYGTFSADGSVRFDAMPTQPAVGATVKIYGIVGQYNGTAQIKNGWIVEQSGASTTPTPTPEPTPSAEPACVTTPEIGKAYKLGLWQVNKSAVYYFTGAMSGYYGATETDKALAVDVYLEDAGNGAFHIYFMDGNTKSYLYGEANGTHLNFKFGATKGVFTWNAAHNTFMTTIGETVVFMGTYNNYVTFGMSAEDKIETSYAAHLYN